jgi:hypothetical protein
VPWFEEKSFAAIVRSALFDEVVDEVGWVVGGLDTGISVGVLTGIVVFLTVTGAVVVTGANQHVVV